MPFPFNLQLEENKIDQDATAVAVGGNGDGNTTANAGNKADIDSNDDLTSTVDYGGDHFLFGGGPLVNVGVEGFDRATAQLAVLLSRCPVAHLWHLATV